MRRIRGPFGGRSPITQEADAPRIRAVISGLQRVGDYSNSMLVGTHEALRVLIGGEVPDSQAWGENAPSGEVGEAQFGTGLFPTDPQAVDGGNPDSPGRVYWSGFKDGVFYALDFPVRHPKVEFTSDCEVDIDENGRIALLADAVFTGAGAGPIVNRYFIDTFPNDAGGFNGVELPFVDPGFADANANYEDRLGRLRQTVTTSGGVSESWSNEVIYPDLTTDVISDVVVSGADDRANLQYTVSDAGTLFYVWTGSTDPLTTGQISAGEDQTGSEALAAGSVAITEAGPQSNVVESGLADGVIYCHLFFIDDGGNETAIQVLGPVTINQTAEGVAAAISSDPVLSGTFQVGVPFQITVGDATGSPEPNVEFILYRDNAVYIADAEVLRIGPNTFEHTPPADSEGLTYGFVMRASNGIGGEAVRFTPASPPIAAADTVPDPATIVLTAAVMVRNSDNTLSLQLAGDETDVDPLFAEVSLMDAGNAVETLSVSLPSPDALISVPFVAPTPPGAEMTIRLRNSDDTLTSAVRSFTVPAEVEVPNANPVAVTPVGAAPVALNSGGNPMTATIDRSEAGPGAFVAGGFQFRRQLVTAVRYAGVALPFKAVYGSDADRAVWAVMAASDTLPDDPSLIEIEFGDGTQSSANPNGVQAFELSPGAIEVGPDLELLNVQINATTGPGAVGVNVDHDQGAAVVAVHVVQNANANALTWAGATVAGELAIGSHRISSAVISAAAAAAQNLSISASISGISATSFQVIAALVVNPE